VFSLVNSAVNMTLPAFPVVCRSAAPLLLSAGAYCRVSIEISCPWGAQQQTRRTPLAVERWDRQTDGHLTVA